MKTHVPSLNEMPLTFRYPAVTALFAVLTYFGLLWAATPEGRALPSWLVLLGAILIYAFGWLVTKHVRGRFNRDADV